MSNVAMSRAEELLALHLRSLSIAGHEREYRFAPPRRWRADFAWPAKRLLVEVEGGTWTKKSRHTTGTGYAADCEKYNAAAEAGYTVLRYTTDQIKSGEAVQQIARMLAGQHAVAPR